MHYPTQEMALAAARSELERRGRQQITLSVKLAEGRTYLVAEGRIKMVGFREGVDGEWSVTRTTHTLDGSGYHTTAEAEQPNEGEAPEVEELVE
jgi:phage protein D